MPAPRRSDRHRDKTFLAGAPASNSRRLVKARPEPRHASPVGATGVATTAKVDLSRRSASRRDHRRGKAPLVGATTVATHHRAPKPVIPSQRRGTCFPLSSRRRPGPGFAPSRRSIAPPTGTRAPFWRTAAPRSANVAPFTRNAAAFFAIAIVEKGQRRPSNGQRCRFFRHPCPSEAQRRPFRRHVCPILVQRCRSEGHRCRFFRHRRPSKRQRCPSNRHRCRFFRHRWPSRRQRRPSQTEGRPRRRQPAGSITSRPASTCTCTRWPGANPARSSHTPPSRSTGKRRLPVQNPSRRCW